MAYNVRIQDADSTPIAVITGRATGSDLAQKIFSLLRETPLWNKSLYIAGCVDNVAMRGTSLSGIRRSDLQEAEARNPQKSTTTHWPATPPRSPSPSPSTSRHRTSRIQANQMPKVENLRLRRVTDDGDLAREMRTRHRISQ